MSKVQKKDNVLVTRPAHQADALCALIEKQGWNAIRFPTLDIVAVDNDMMVSSDLIGNTNSTIVAGDLTQVVGEDMIKIMTWYDNEWGYSSRLIDMAVYVANK